MQSPKAPIDLIVFGGAILLTAAGEERVTALAVSGGRVVAIGGDQEVLSSRGPHTELIDLAGKTVLPGFIDAHVHAFDTGLAATSASLSEARSVPQIVSLLRDHAKTLPSGRWVLGMGLPARDMREGRLPTKCELDEVSQQHPVYVCTDTVHAGAVNTVGLRLTGLDKACFGVTTGPDGEPTGQLESDDAHFAGMRTVLSSLSDAEIEAAYRTTAAAALKRGVTTIHCLEGQFIDGGRDIDIIQRMGASLPLHIVLYYQTLDVERVVALGLPRIGGCLTVDGACFEHSALFYEPYADRPDTCGHLYISKQEVENFVLAAHDAGLQIAMHAIGDRAIDIVVDAYERAFREIPKADMRHRVEHFVCPTPHARDLARRRRLGIVMQPASTAVWDQPGSSSYVRALGERRAADCEPFGQCLRDGVLIAGSSDSPVLPIDPLAGMDALIHDPRPQRRCSVREALGLFTEQAAWMAHEETERGSLTVGEYADFVVLDRDPLDGAGRIADTEVLMTFAEGQLVYEQ